MKRLQVISYFILLSAVLSAQTDNIIDLRAEKTTKYLFQIGDTIMFYPINPKYVGPYSNGYPCFYDIKCLKSGIKPKYRFAVNEMRLTPISEIENSFFYVKSRCGSEFNKKNKLSYSVILERLSDHTEICFAFPLDFMKEPKESILNSWIVKEQKGIGYFQKTLYSLVIPYITKHFIDEFNALNGKTLIYNKVYRTNEEDYLMLKFANAEDKVNRLANLYSSGVGPGSEFEAGKMEFISWGNNLVYRQPYLNISEKGNGNKYLIPAAHFAGNSNVLYVIRGEVENLPKRHFIEEESYLRKLKSTQPNMDYLLGKVYYFDNSNYYYSKTRREIEREITYLGSSKLYNIKNGYYKCVDFDYFRNPYGKSNFFDFYVVLEDSMGQRFKFPETFDYNNYGRKERIKFTKVFDTKEAREEQLRKEALDEKEKNRLIAKYGEDVGFAIYIKKCTEERYNALCKKYGKKKAGLMARRIYEVGWTYKEFCEAKNPIVKFECVYTHENRHAYYEVYKYGEYSPTYITFKNNVIVSIDDYMNSDF